MSYMMTRGVVRTRVEVIREHATLGRNEVAHQMEDDLWEDVLTYIAQGKCDDQWTDAVALAAAALKTRDINYERWYE